jgi:SAM-dependent methyltransferase
MTMIADWQLPPGVNRGLWDYVHDPAIARSYDAGLADCHLLRIDQEFALRHFPRPGRLLDLGCGTGRLLIPFARRGFWTVGVDLSSEMLKVAADKASASGAITHHILANIVDLAALDNAIFDYAACLFSTFGMVLGAEMRQRVLGHVFRLLRPGGKFALHVHNRWFNIWNRRTRGWLIKDCLRSLIGNPSAGDFLMPAHLGLTGLTLHLFTRREIICLLRGIGFRVLEVAPVSLRPDGKLPWPRCFGWLRAYGYLLAVEKPR